MGPQYGKALLLDMIPRPRFWGPPGGPSFGSVFVAKLLNAALDAVPQSRPPLLMNRDQTAILRHVSGLRGTATSKMQVAADRAPLSARRSSTLFACLHLRRCRYVKTTLERCGPFSLVVLSQRRSQVTPLSGHSDQNASETFSNKLQLNKVQSSLRQTSAKTTQVRSKAKTS